MAATNRIAYHDARRKRGKGQSVALELLESRLALAADLGFGPIEDQAVLGGAPLWLGIDGVDSANGPLTYTVTVSNPELLSASLSPASNSSLQMEVAGYGRMTFQLFDDLKNKGVGPGSGFIIVIEA